MNPVRKRLKLTPSKLQNANNNMGAAHPATPSKLIYHDALLPPPLPASAGARAEEEEEDESYLVVEEDVTDSSLVITMEESQLEVRAQRSKPARKRKKQKTLNEEDSDVKERASETEEEDETGVEVEIDRQLDQSLETKSKQHNLTSVNVKNIIHEVITNEHVVAMMKAAINETEAVPPFEPKMTRSKFKEVVEKGVVIPTWNISPIKKSSDLNKAPQFVDIPLDEEDSSDEEYRPDEDEEDETAEDTFHESDMESTASSPRGSRLHRGDEDSCSPWQTSRVKPRRFKAGSMGPPPPPKAPPTKTVTDSTFLEKLHAVEEELADWMEPYQPLSESEDEAGVMAYRTRSKRPLRDVPLGQLEAALRAPDITPDMYDSSSAHEDREWTDWLRGLMSSDVDNEEECDDEDDPEYNFLADNDEPDQEDYRDDKAVRITKKEVNELMEELFETLKEDLARPEVDDEGHEEEEEPLHETSTVQTHALEEQHHIETVDDEADGLVTEVRTVRQQLALMRKRRQTHCNTNSQCSEPYTLKLNTQQKSRLQQQLQQHVQLLTQIHLLTAPVVKLHSDAETTRQFLFELDMLAQRAELIRSAVYPGFCSAFRVTNLQGALELLEELQQTPINYQPQLHPPDARGYMRSFPVMPPELAWIFATRPVFLYPELLPCASLDPALYCPRRMTAFTAAEDCLLVLGLRNMEGSCDPPKLVSQFLLRKTLVQVRRRILQCCRPGFPDNIIKAFRYQQVLWPMPVACRHVDPAEHRPPVEREESIMPLWLVRSLPVIHPTIQHFNSPSEAPSTCRRAKLRQGHLAFLRFTMGSYSFPPGTKYPPRLPNNLDLKRIGFVMLPEPLPIPPPDSPPNSDDQVNSSSPSVTPPRLLSPPRVVLKRLILSRADPPANIKPPSTVSMETIEQIRSHCKTLASLRKRRLLASPAAEKPSLNEEDMRNGSDEDTAPPIGDAATLQERVDDVIRKSDGEVKEEEEEVEEESDVLLALSESSSCTAQDDSVADLEEVESESEHEVTVVPSKVEDDGRTSSNESRGSVIQLQERLSEEETDEEDDDQRKSEDILFAQDYLQRVCETVQVSPGCSERLLQVLDEFSALGPSVASEMLYDRLSCVLRPWPQLLKDFAAFLNRTQARKCGLLLEQQLFERSRTFLRRLGRSLGESSPLYQQVVSLLQGSSTASSEDTEKVLSLLRHDPNLHEEIQQFFQEVQTGSSPAATSTSNVDFTPQSSPGGNRRRINTQSESYEEKEAEHQAVCAKNITMTSTGEKVVVWTREADRTILTACQQRGASRKTFRQVSAQLGNKTAQQVQLRFHDLMKLFHSASNKSTSWLSESQPISGQATD